MKQKILFRIEASTDVNFVEMWSYDGCLIAIIRMNDLHRMCETGTLDPSLENKLGDGYCFDVKGKIKA